MSGIWGKNVKLSIFGESHGAAVGITMDGLPPGFEIDWGAVAFEMARRAPGRNAMSTPRAETDAWEILSGVFENRTTGTPLCAIIRNEDKKPGDYERGLPRPGHADLTAVMKYGGYADYRGGGHFSGRLTAPLTFAGAIAKQLLLPCGIRIGSRIAQIYDIVDSPPQSGRTADTFAAIAKKPFPTHSDAAAEKMLAAIAAARDEGDSVGGVVECAAFGLPGGWGDPFFDSLESRISAMMFSIPAVKGIEFGDGFGLAALRGSEANDGYAMRSCGRNPAMQARMGDASGGTSHARASRETEPNGERRTDGAYRCGSGSGSGSGSGDSYGSEACPDSPRDCAARAAASARALTNRSGGVNGGISNGETLIFRVAIKPTPTIKKAQRTVDLSNMRDVTASFGGRHDPCIVPRAAPVVEAGLALCLLDCKPGLLRAR